MKIENKVLAVACGGLYFFLSAFYYKVDAGLQEMAKINTTLAVAVSEMKGLDKRVGRVEDSLSIVESDVKKLNGRVIALESNSIYIGGKR